MEDRSLMAAYSIEQFRGSRKRLRQIAVSYTGALQTGRTEEKVLLLCDPLSQQTFFYEFRPKDIVYVEECPNLSMEDGSALAIVRVWVRKGTTALKIVPFHVEETSGALMDFF